MRERTTNPFISQGFSFEAWEQGYNSNLEIENQNPYPDNSILYTYWQEGRNSRIFDISLIPVGCYCYSGSKAPGDSAYYRCPFWSREIIPEGEFQGELFGACGYLGIKKFEDSDGVLYDQVKICGEKNDFED